MVALSTIIIFFFVLVVVYPAVVGILVLYGWIKKRRVIGNLAGSTQAAQIDEATDRLKNRLFIITLILAFFVIAPFLALLVSIQN
jgi:hypothetical protein